MPLDNAVEHKNLVSSVIKAGQILDCFTPDNHQLNLTQISNKLNFPKSTTLNLLQTLEFGGFIIRVKDSNNYQLGYKNMELGYRTMTSLAILPYAIPLIEELQDRTNEIIYLTTHIEGKIFYLHCSYPNKPTVSYSVMGKMLPMHCTGCGKAMLSYLDIDYIDRIIKTYGLAQFTPNTITTKEALLENLEQSRNRGYAIDNQEETLGVKCVAVAIRNASGNSVGAISISGSALSMSQDKFDNYAALLSTSCTILSQQAKLFPASMIYS